MAKETNRTGKPNTTPREKLYDERHRLTPTTSVWAAVPLPVLLMLQHEDMDRAVRVLFYLIEHSWAMLIPPANYRGDGRDRDAWRPSTFAVKTPQKPGPKARSPFWALQYIRSKDIADELGLDEGNVSKELKWLGDCGAIRTDQKRRPIFPIQVLDAPAGLARKKLSDLTTSDFQHPYFQQIFESRLRIEAEYEAAKRAALAPVVEAYRPALEQVNTEERELKKAAKKAKRQGVDLSEVVKVDNFQTIKPINTTDDTPKPAPETPKATFPQVVKVDNSKRLSPIRRVVKVDNFSPRIKSLGVDTTLEDNNNTRPAPEAEGFSVVVAQVLAAIQEHGTTTEAAARKFVLRCREASPQCSGEEIVQAIDTVAVGFSRTTKNPVGVLLTQVPDAIKTTKRKTAKPATHEQRSPDDLTDDAARRNALATLNDERASETEKQLAREIIEQFQQPA